MAEVTPELTAKIMQASTAFLPGEGGIGEDLATGLESRTDLVPDAVTSLIDEAARRNNELKPGEVLS